MISFPQEADDIFSMMLPLKKVVSGGMDSKMWMWMAGSTRGIQMDGHAAPISKVLSNWDDNTGKMQGRVKGRRGDHTFTNAAPRSKSIGNHLHHGLLAVHRRLLILSP